MKINLIIPTYNSTLFIEDFLQKVNNVLSTQHDIQFKIVFIDDGSADNTVAVLKKAKENDPRISIIILSKNYGQTNAILVGLERTQADAYIVMAVDMQEPIELISEFIDSWKNGFKLCIAYRKYRTDNPISKALSKVFYFIINIDENKIPKGGFDYGLMDKEVAQLLVNKPLNFRFLQGDVVNLGYQIHYIPCTRINNKIKKKQFAFSRFKFNYFFDGIINVTRIPFRVFFLLNLLLSLVFTVLLIIKSIQTLLSHSFNLSVLYPYFILVLLSYLLVSAGVIIEFIIRVYDIVTKKTAYVIKEIIE